MQHFNIRENQYVTENGQQLGGETSGNELHSFSPVLGEQLYSSMEEWKKPGDGQFAFRCVLRQTKKKGQEERESPRLHPRLYCYPTVDPAGGQKSSWFGLSCTEVSSPLVCAGIIG